MHWQHQNPLRARDHRISLMPLERPEGELPIRWALVLLTPIAAYFWFAAVIGG